MASAGTSAGTSPSCEAAEAAAIATATAAAAARHAQNKRVITPFVEALLAAAGQHAWLDWFRALRRCVDGKKDDLADALCQGYYELRDRLVAARRAWEAAAAAAARRAAGTRGRGGGRGGSHHAGTKRRRGGSTPAADAPLSRGAVIDLSYDRDDRDDAVAAANAVAPEPRRLRAVSIDLGFKNLAFATLVVAWDARVAAHPLLRGYTLTVQRWERVDCAALAGVPDLHVNATTMARLTEVLMCGVAAHADALFGTAPLDDAHGGLDYFLLELQKAATHGVGGGTNIKTYCASHVLQACLLLHYAAARRAHACPAVVFVSASKKTQDADVAAVLALTPPAPPPAAPPAALPLAGPMAAGPRGRSGPSKNTRAPLGAAAALKERALALVAASAASAAAPASATPRYQAMLTDAAAPPSSAATTTAADVLAFSAAPAAAAVAPLPLFAPAGVPAGVALGGTTGSTTGGTTMGTTVGTTVGTTTDAAACATIDTPLWTARFMVGSAGLVRRRPRGAAVGGAAGAARARAPKVLSPPVATDDW